MTPNITSQSNGRYRLTILLASVVMIPPAIAQVGGPGPVCLLSDFVRYACDGTVDMSDPQCGPDTVLINESVYNIRRIGESGEGCGYRQPTSEWVECRKQFFVYNEDLQACESGGIAIQFSFSRWPDPTSPSCGSC